MYRHADLFHYSDPRCQVNNYARVQWLLTEQGTYRMKKFVFDNLPTGQTFEDALLLNKHKLEYLVKKRLINKTQLNILYPTKGILNVGKIDLSLAYVLARNITIKQNFQWQKFEKSPPKAEHQEDVHHIVRLRNARNTLSHIRTATLEQGQFIKIWKELETALIGLNEPKEIVNNFLKGDLDPLHKMNAQYKLLEDSENGGEIPLVVKRKTLRQYMCPPWFVKTFGVTLLLLTILCAFYVAELRNNKYSIDPNQLTTFHFVQVFLIAFLVLVCGVLFYFVVIRPNNDTKQEIGNDNANPPRSESSIAPSMNTVSICTEAGIMHVMPRRQWGAKPSKGTLELMPHPADYVIISHSADIGRFETTPECCDAVRTAQNVGFDVGFDDIAYNYLVGNDGVIYEGRGWTYVPSTAKGWNRNSIGIGFIGKFCDKLPSVEALDACKAFLQYMVDQGILKSDFTIYGLCQVRAKFPDAPGAMLFKEIQTWHGKGKNNTWSWEEKDPPPYLD